MISQLLLQQHYHIFERAITAQDKICIYNTCLVRKESTETLESRLIVFSMNMCSQYFVNKCTKIVQVPAPCQLHNTSRFIPLIFLYNDLQSVSDLLLQRIKFYKFLVKSRKIAKK